MPIIPRFQQESDPNQPPRIDFGDRLVQGMMAGAQAQRFAAEADYRKQMAAIQQEELGMAREQRAMAQQERQDFAKMEEFFAVRQAGAQQPPMQRQEPQPSPLVSPAPAMGGILSPERAPSTVTPSDLEGAKLFASQLGSDSARAMFFNRYREVLKNDVVMADVRKTQDAYGNLIAGVKGNQNFVDPSTGQSIFETEITNLATLLDTLDDQGQTAESRAATTSAVMQAVNQLQKMANDEETRITRYGVTMNSLDAAIGAVKPNSPEAKALIERRSQFKNKPKATSKEIDDVETSISNISAGRTQYSEKLGDWFTPEERVRRESEMEVNQQRSALLDVQRAEAEGRADLMEMSILETAVNVESKIKELTDKVFGGQFLIDELTGALTKDLAIDPQFFRSREAIESEFRGRLDKVRQFSNRRGTMESARAEGEDVAASIAGDIVGGSEQKPTVAGGEQKPPTTSTVTPPPAEAVVNPNDYSFEGLRSSGKMSLDSIEAQKADLLSRRRALNENGITPSRNREKASKIESALKQIGAAEDRIKKAYEAFKPSALIERLSQGPFAVFNGPYGLEKARRGKTSSPDDFNVLYEYLSNDSRFSDQLARLRSLSDEDFTYEYNQVPRNMK
jgi:hypothetical protein